jgi:peptidoglycan/LPS O-acetylase OafA/YrhL
MLLWAAPGCRERQVGLLHDQVITSFHSETSKPAPLFFRGHIAGLDVLRGIAILSVMLFHSFDNVLDGAGWHGLIRDWILLTGIGRLGVHLFFVLSGFLITGILMDSTGKAGRARRFWERRARRILPAYILVLAALMLAGLVNWHFTLACLLFVPNFGRLVGVHLSDYTIVWSLAVEEQFYLLWPWIVWGASRKTIGRTIVAALLLTPLLRLLLAVHGQDTYFKTYDNFDYLMYGALIAYTLRTGLLHTGNIEPVIRRLYAAAAVGFLFTMLLWKTVGTPAWLFAIFLSIGLLPYVALFAALVLRAVLQHHRASLLAANVDPHAASLPQLRPARPAQPGPVSATLAFFGYISYGLYLVHMLIFALYNRHVAGTRWADFWHSFPLLPLRAVLCCSLSVLIAWLSRSTIEAWFLRRNQAPASLTSAPETADAASEATRR